MIWTTSSSGVHIGAATTFRCRRGGLVTAGRLAPVVAQAPEERRSACRASPRPWSGQRPSAWDCGLRCRSRCSPAAAGAGTLRPHRAGGYGWRRSRAGPGKRTTARRTRRSPGRAGHHPASRRHRRHGIGPPRGAGMLCPLGTTVARDAALNDRPGNVAAGTRVGDEECFRCPSVAFRYGAHGGRPAPVARAGRAPG